MYYEQKVKIIPHGFVKDLIPEGIELSGSNAYEIINGLCKQYKSLQAPIEEERYSFQLAVVDEKDNIIELNIQEQIKESLPPNTRELHIFPEMSGGKGGGGFFRIIVGAVLIATAFYLGGPTLAGPALFGDTTIAGLLFNFGVSLVLGGLLELLSPAPEIDKFGQSESDPEASRYLGASQNTVKIGTRIPLLYGKHKAFGHYISFDVDAKDIAI